MFNLARNGYRCTSLIKLASQAIISEVKTLKNGVQLTNCKSSISNRARFCTASKQPEVPVQEDTEETAFNFDEITNGDKDAEHKLKVIMLEMEVLRQEGKPIPEESELKTNHWIEILKLQSRSGRKKYLDYLFKNFRRKENQKLRKEEKQSERFQNEEEKPARSENLEEFVHTYNLQNNNIFLRFYDQTINNMYNNKLIQAMQFGQKLVIDCGYDEHMNLRENKNCAKQLMLLFAENRAHNDPFDLHYCNANLESSLMKTLHRHVPTIYEPTFPLNIHEKSYLDIIPKNQLVYLTPHCREEMKTFDHDAVYIVGGIVDRVSQAPVSLAKAKREGLKMMKFPLDKYLQWGSGSGKSLTLNQVVSILLDLKETGDWQFALRHVPRRKLIDYNSEPDRFSNIESVSNTLRYDREEHVPKRPFPKYNATKKWSPRSLDKMSFRDEDEDKGDFRRSSIKDIFKN